MNVTLEAAYAADLDVSLQLRQNPPSNHGESARARFARTVYTAFDGDHFALVPLMRKHALSHRCLPLNPESVVGYKDSVDAYGTKFGVLKADIAVIDKCDAIWIYTDRVNDARDLRLLAEGVILELLWFVRRAHQAGVDADVRTVSLQSLLHDAAASPRRLQVTWAELTQSLREDQTDLLDRLDDLDRWGLPSLAFCLFDPLDAKYADWLRVRAHQESQVNRPGSGGGS